MLWACPSRQSAVAKPAAPQQQRARMAGATALAGQQQTPCAACGAPPGNLKRCSICKAVYYCNIECQRNDIARHRREDGCGSTSSRPPSAGSCVGAAITATTAAGRGACAAQTLASGGGGLSSSAAASTGSRTSASAAPAKPTTGPLCLRCRKPAGEETSRFVAQIVQRSIYANDCTHGPYCASCAARMQRQTLSFCLGCSALVNRMEAEVSVDSKPAPPATADATSSEAKRSAVDVVESNSTVASEVQDSKSFDRLD